MPEQDRYPGDTEPGRPEALRTGGGEARANKGRSRLERFRKAVSARLHRALYVVQSRAHPRRFRWLRTYSLATAVGAIVIGSHFVLLATADVPGLSVEQADLAQVSSTLTQLWAVEASILSAMLVAVVFALTSVQAWRPTRAALSLLRAELRVGWVVAFFLSQIAATTVTVFLLQPASWRPGLPLARAGAIAALDFVLFLVGLCILAWAVRAAIRYVHPSTVHALSLRAMRHLAAEVAAFETIHDRARQRLVDRIGLMALHVGPRDEYVPPERRELIAHLNETQETAMRAVEADEVSQLRVWVDERDELLRGHIAGQRSAAPPKADHQSPMEIEWDSRVSDPVAFHRYVWDTIALLDRALESPSASRCAPQLLWAAHRGWHVGFAQESHEAARLAIGLSARCYLRLRRASRTDLVDTWTSQWRDTFNGPEGYVRSDIAKAVKDSDAAEETHLHAMQAMYEIDYGRALGAALALGERDIHTFYNLVLSMSTTRNVLWPPRNHPELYTEKVRQRARRVEEALAETAALLLALAAVTYVKGADITHTFPDLFDVVEERFRNAEMQPHDLATSHQRSEWQWDAIIYDGDAMSLYGDDVTFDIAMNDMRAWAFLILLPRCHKSFNEAVEHTPRSTWEKLGASIGRVLPTIRSAERDLSSLLPVDFYAGLDIED